MSEMNAADQAVQTVPADETVVGLLREISDRLARIEGFKREPAENDGAVHTLMPKVEQVEDVEKDEIVTSSDPAGQTTVGKFKMGVILGSDTNRDIRRSKCEDRNGQCFIPCEPSIRFKKSERKTDRSTEGLSRKS